MLMTNVKIMIKRGIDKSDVKIVSYIREGENGKLELELLTSIYDKLENMTRGIEDAKLIASTIERFKEDNESIEYVIEYNNKTNYEYMDTYIDNMNIRLLAEGHVVKLVDDDNIRVVGCDGIIDAINIIKRYGSMPSNRFKLEDLLNDVLTDNEMVSYKILEHDVLINEGYELITAVGKGNKSSKLCHISYRGNKGSNDTIVLIGKGVNFDTGGYSLKPNQSMVGMSKDKLGAVTLLALVKYLIDSKMNVNVDIITGWAENMIDGFSYKPGDVLKSKSGIEVEITNTDAEGRLVLADCIEYMKDNVYKDMNILGVFTLATLTGGAMRAAGFRSTVLTGYKNSVLSNIYKTHASTNEEDVLMLHYTREVIDKVKSKIADIKNAADDKLSAQTGGYFINKFVPDDLKERHLHIDIAGSGYTTDGYLYNTYGPTGVVLKPLLDVIKTITIKRS